ncbi:hypothetical protein AVMA1855_19925 [Acidovorax sp. SUPP1855]|uniref:hypothetical protein n=1 Tax=Acidovorax sp. SUPP1855 TaxID=431774 RepID=UPI0023DE427E|nr:hypothetical protein [Acidovorax sp. SUPP1855]GKS86459.1 hypothetical protein AVMA1855_19925 [Acidovorax sp. SUPP1855]
MTKKSTRNESTTVRIGPRMSRGLYQLAKYVYGAKRVNFEDQLEELVEKDLDYQMKQKWFLNYTSGKEGQYFEKLRKAVGEARDGAFPVDGSDFDSNNVSGDE